MGAKKSPPRYTSVEKYVGTDRVKGTSKSCPKYINGCVAAPFYILTMLQGVTCLSRYPVSRIPNPSNAFCLVFHVIMIVDEIFSPYKNEATGMWSIRTFNDYEERPTKGKPWSVNSSEKKKNRLPCTVPQFILKWKKFPWNTFWDKHFRNLRCLRNSKRTL